MLRFLLGPSCFAGFWERQTVRGGMNYPVWYIPEVGGGLLIAIIAIVHVFISHFAVGGGLYLVFAERMGLREKNRAILDFTKSHAKFFLLMTLVAGGVTGITIWFIISLVHPAAKSAALTVPLIVAPPSALQEQKTVSGTIVWMLRETIGIYRP